MKVMKFGGAVLRTAQGFARMAEMVAGQCPGPVVVVVSAMASTTRDLEAIARLALAGDAVQARREADGLFAQHMAVVDELPTGAGTNELYDGLRDLLGATRAELDGLIEGILITRQVTPRTLDTVLSIGELLSMHVARHVLAARGISVASIDARLLIVTDDAFGQATPLLEQSSVRIEHELRPLLTQYDVVVVQGFVGRTESGATTTMGKESSNLTAVMLAALLHAPTVTIYTDVAGVRSADPVVCASTLPRPSMSYADARLAATHGVKVLYPTMIDPAERAGVAITIAGVDSEQDQSTTIQESGGPCADIVVLQPTAPNLCMVTYLFGNGRTWLKAVDDVLTQCSPASFDMTWQAAERIGSLTIPDTIAEQALRIVHQRCIA